MSDPSFYEAVDKWLGSKAWPRNGEPDSVLVLNAVNDDGTVFRFHSGFGLFEVLGIYDSNVDILTDLEIILVVPLHPKDTTLTYTTSYALSTEPGASIKVNISEGYIKGDFTFQYGELEGKKNIFLKYRADLPFAGTLDDVISIAPATLSDAFTEEEIKAIPTFASSRPLGYAAASGAVTTKDVDNETQAEQELLVRFLKDFVVDDSRILISTHSDHANARSLAYPGDSVTTLAYSRQKDFSVSFLNFLELSGSVDPDTLTIAAGLYANVPIAGKVRLVGIGGTLGVGVSTGIDIWIAKGSVKVFALKNAQSRWDVYIELSVSIKFIGTIATTGKQYLFTTS